MNLPLSLYGLTSERLVESLYLPEKRYGGQILAWLGKGAITFDEMTDLPLDERKRLSDLVGSPISSETTVREEDESGTIKLGITLHDGKMIEAVLSSTVKDGTACLCPGGMCDGVHFCKTG